MRYKKIHNRLFIKNRQKLKDLILPDSTVILFAADEIPRNGDQYFPYRQSSDLFYLTGIEQERTIFIMNPFHKEEKFHEALFIIRSDPNKETWDGRKLEPDEALEISGIKNIFWLDDFEKLLREILIHSRNIYINYPEHFKIKPDIKINDERMAHRIRSLFPLHSYQRLAPLLWKLRMIKEPEEIELIKRACSITGGALIKVLKFIKPGLKEYEIEAEITHEFIRSGANGHAYEPVIASGKNACILHYNRNDQRCKNGEMVLMDFGAEYANYAADLTRTVPVNGKFTKRQAQIYDATLRILKSAQKLMKPGVLIDDFHNQICSLWQDEHMKLGLYKSSDLKKDDIQPPVWFNYYMHGTSHSIGLDVHDMIDRSETFQSGMVLSCEPGIYIKNEGLGIRLENDILITEKDNLDLMKNVPIERNEIVEIMRK